MNIIQKNINEIRPDPEQPRKNFPEKRIREMAKSILTEGVINPIEIDKDGVIVTGEIRWRAAKEAGLTEVPVKVIDPGETRFRRQVIENVHHNTMTTMETARALAKLLPTVREVTQGKDVGINKLAKEIGKSDSYIQDHLKLLDESDDVQTYLDKEDSKYSLIREINNIAPDIYKKELKKRVASGEINSWRVATELSRTLRDRPEKAQELLEADLDGNDVDAIHIIKTIAPEEKTVDDVADKIITYADYIVTTLVPELVLQTSIIRRTNLTYSLKRLDEHLKRYLTDKEYKVEEGEIVNEPKTLQGNS
jgi:ParB family transcriptional regulator, chromosome partitioning protein